MASDSKKICVGVIGSANGIRGKVKIKTFTTSPEDIENFSSVFDDNHKKYQIKVVGIKKDIVIAFIEGITSRNDAESLLNTKLYTTRNELPRLENDEFYECDLVNLEVHSESGIKLGYVKNVLNYGAGYMLEIIHNNATKTTIYPFNKDTFPEINIQSGYIVYKEIEEILAY